MRVQFITSISIPFKDFFNGRLLKYNIRELVTGETTKYRRYLMDKDGNNITVVADQHNCTDYMIACELSKNPPWIILDAVATEFDCDIRAENDLAISH
jgi:hypothetical protein